MNQEEIVKPTTKKQGIIFFSVAFIFNYLMGIGIYIGKTKGVDVNSFANFQMMTPALGAILAMWLSNPSSKLLPRVSFSVYTVISALMAIVSWIPIFSPDFPAYMSSSVLMVIGSVLFMIALFIDGKKKREAYGLSFGHLGKVALMLGLFLFLYFVRIAIVTTLETGFDSFLAYFTSDKILMVITIVANMFLSFLPFFGEEYGWRYFLQPILQKKTGMLKGLLVLGVLWGLWHLPLNLFYYSADGTALLSIVNQIILCVSYTMMFGYAYSYSGSIWAPTLIHYLNNNLVLFFASPEELMNPDIGQNQNYTWEMIAIMAVFNLLLYGVFVFSKRNRDESYRMPTPNERIDMTNQED